MHRLIQISFAFLAVLTSALAFGQTTESSYAQQDLDALRSHAEQFLKTQSAAMPGEIAIRTERIDPRTNVAACTDMEAFMPAGRRAWGKTAVGLRCKAPTRWTVYVKATVSVTGEYIAAAGPLAQGHVITPNDLVTVKGDLTSLPNGSITSASDAIGKKILISIPLGSPIRKELLRQQLAVQSGQNVHLVSKGTGFKVTAEGRALGNANDGQMVQTRTPSGQIVSGIARVGGVVEVSF